MNLPPALKRYTQWLGFTAVLIPLLVLLALQYRSLARLDQTSALVHKAVLNNFLEGVSKEVDYFYRNNAERVLDLPASVFTQNQLAKAASHFKKKGVEGVKRLFVVSFQDGDDRPRYFYPSCETFQPPPWSPELTAVYVASSPWRLLAMKNARVERVRLTVEEKDPAYRILLYPITDDASKLVGLAGMVLDEDYFRARVLPMAVSRSLAAFDSGELEPLVSVTDAKGRTVYATGPLHNRRMEVEKPFSLVFTDWTIGLASRHATPAAMARRSFLVNVGLSAALAAVLLGGVLLTLRTSSREMKLSRMKNEFVSNVSHELRTPLASIRVFAELLRLGRVETPEKTREYGEYIETESRRLSQLINNILDFASIESGRKTYHFERCDVREVVCETLKTFGVRLRQSGFNIHLEGADIPLPPARIDAGAVAQSLSNLLDNAVKYSHGKTEVTVALRRDGDWIVVAVTDQGIGIPRDEQRKIFDRFHRVSTGLVHDVKGSGLGLSIVRHIVDAHRGRVTVESRPGEGSTFSIHLPVEVPETASSATAPSQEALLSRSE
jgi:signal transduction histidine kinase